MSEARAQAPAAGDRLPGAPHPSEAPGLIGQEAAEAAMLAAMASGRLHHAWLLAGPRGVGKATLAYRAARARLACEGAPASLDVPPDHPIARRIRAGSEPRLAVLRREWDAERGRLPEGIGVDAVRRLARALAMAPPDGGWRVLIVDAADELTPAAANALLKALEEPPARVLFLLVAHRPSALLPTIRSRCRILRLRALDAGEMARALAPAPGCEDARALAALAALSDGSVGEAWRLALGEGAALYGEVATLLAQAPGMSREGMLRLAEGAAARGREARRDLLVTLIGRATARLARTGVEGAPDVEAAPREAAMLARLSPDAAAARLWAEAHATLVARAEAALGVNLDPALVLLDTLRRIDETAARAVRAAQRPSDDGRRGPAPDHR